MKIEEVSQSDLEDFQKQINNAASTQEAAKKKMSMKKNIVLAYVCDSSGCGHIRCVFPFAYMNSIFGKTGNMYATVSPFFITQQDILMQTRSIFFQRQMNPSQVAAIQNYKSHQPIFKYKMMYDIDDYIWGYNELQPNGNKEDGVPSYNFGYPNITDEVKKSCNDIMSMMDVITVSSDFLKYYIENVLKINVPVVVVKNTISKFFWGLEKRKGIDKKLIKPRVVYTGSPTHYSNEKKMLGDWDTAWRDYVIKAVKTDKIEFICMGGCPWFFESIKSKIHVIDWVNSFQYHLAVKETKPDFIIAPLIPNNFNRSKSNIKMIESHAVGGAFIGNKFADGSPSPYDDSIIPALPNNCSVSDIEQVVDEYCRPDKFNRVIKQQYEYLDKNNHWTESPGFISQFTKYL